MARAVGRIGRVVLLWLLSFHANFLRVVD